VFRHRKRWIIKNALVRAIDFWISVWAYLMAIVFHQKNCDRLQARLVINCQIISFIYELPDLWKTCCFYYLAFYHRVELKSSGLQYRIVIRLGLWLSCHRALAHITNTHYLRCGHMFALDANSGFQPKPKFEAKICYPLKTSFIRVLIPCCMLFRCT